MKRKIVKLGKYDDLRNLDSDFLGEGKRLDIMLDVSTGELWSDYCTCNSWEEYSDTDVIKIGYAENWLDMELLKEEYGDSFGEDEMDDIKEEVTGWKWRVGIEPDGGDVWDYDFDCRLSSESAEGDVWDDHYRVDAIIDLAQEILDKIKDD